jgi:hypothetical protein
MRSPRGVPELARAGQSSAAARPARRRVPRWRAARRRSGAPASAASLLASVTVLTAVAGAADSAVPAAPRRGAVAAASAQVPVGSLTVGALFQAAGGRLGRHFCTASVVHSSSGDLLITAAHCMVGRRLSPPGSLVFAPGYRDGRFPLGLWNVMAVFVTSRWSADRDANQDVAFLAVSRPGATLERLAGAEYLRTGEDLPAAVQVVGYPSTASQPVVCSATATAFITAMLRQMRFECPGFTNGTSGGPFLVRAGRTPGQWQVIGVIGGYQEGGDLPSVSYSATFTRDVADLYRTADTWSVTRSVAAARGGHGARRYPAPAAFK